MPGQLRGPGGRAIAALDTGHHNSLIASRRSMSAEQTALSPTEAGALVEVPDSRLRPSPWWADAGTILGVYFALLVPASFIGFGAELAVVVGALVFAIHRRRAWFRSVALQREIQLALAGDDVAEAARLGRRLVTETPGRSLAHAVAVAWWGSIELRRGRPEQAVDVMQRALATGRFTGRTGRILEIWRLEAALALAQAVVGDLDAAHQQLQSADAKVSDRARGGLFTVRAYVLARRGETEQVVSLFDAQWRDAEPQLSISGARAARMLEAFALERTHGHEYRSDVGDRIDKAIERAREGRAGAYGYLAVRWPELAEFLARHRLD